MFREIHTFAGPFLGPRNECAARTPQTRALSAMCVNTRPAFGAGDEIGPYMPRPSAAEITALCQKCYDAYSPDPTSPGLMTAGPPEPFRLTNNGAVFHEMSFDELVAALVGLNKFLLRPVMAIILHEHFLLWSWCAELLIGGHATGQPNNIRHVEPLFFATIRAALASAPPRLKLPGNDPQFLNAAEFLSTANIVFAHMSFPLLEAECKRSCSQYVNV